MLKVLLIVGLGNPDPQYQATRHNIGFMFLDRLAKTIKAKDFSVEKKFSASVVSGQWGRYKVILAKPQTYVNQSGLAAKKLKNAYRLKNENLLIVHDDLDIPFGSSKLTAQSGDGGHRGIRSIQQQLKTEKITRLKIGLANSGLKKARAQRSDQKRKEAVVKFVLSSFTPTEKKQLASVFKKGWKKIEQMLRSSLNPFV